MQQNPIHEVSESKSKQDQESLQSLVDSPGEKSIRQLLEEAVQEGIAWAKTQHPVLLAIYVIAGLIVVVAGAIIFFVLTGALDKDYSRKTLNTMEEVTAQMLNAVFTAACIVLCPGRIVSGCQYCSASCSKNSKYDDLNSNRAMLNEKFPFVVPKPADGQIDGTAVTLEEKSSKRWSYLGYLLILQNIHWALQFVVAAYMWLFNFYNRPSYFGYIVGAAIAVGCGTGIVEGYLMSLK